MKTKKTPPDNPIYSAGEKTQQLLRFFRSKKRIQQRNRTVKQTKPGTKADRQEGPRTGKKASGQAGKPQDRQEGLRTGRRRKLDKKTEQQETNHVRHTHHGPSNYRRHCGTDAGGGWLDKLPAGSLEKFILSLLPNRQPTPSSGARKKESKRETLPPSSGGRSNARARMRTRREKTIVKYIYAS